MLIRCKLVAQIAQNKWSRADSFNESLELLHFHRLLQFRLSINKVIHQDEKVPVK